MADVDPVGFYAECAHPLFAVQALLDQRWQRKFGRLWYTLYDGWLQHVNPGVRQPHLRRLFAHLDNAVVDDVDDAERNRVRVFVNADRRAVGTARVKVHQAVDVELREVIAVQHQELMVRHDWEQRQRASGSERLLFAQIFDGAAKPAAAAEVRFDDVGFVIHRQKNMAHAGTDEMQDDSLENRPPGDVNHRFRHGVSERPQPLASYHGHDHRPIRTLRDAQYF